MRGRWCLTIKAGSIYRSIFFIGISKIFRRYKLLMRLAAVGVRRIRPLRICIYVFWSVRLQALWALSRTTEGRSTMNKKKKMRNRLEQTLVRARWLKKCRIAFVWLSASFWKLVNHALRLHQWGSRCPTSLPRQSRLRTWARSSPRSIGMQWISGGPLRWIKSTNRTEQKSTKNYFPILVSTGRLTDFSFWQQTAQRCVLLLVRFGLVKYVEMFSGKRLIALCVFRIKVILY